MFLEFYCTRIRGLLRIAILFLWSRTAVVFLINASQHSAAAVCRRSLLHHRYYIIVVNIHVIETEHMMRATI